MYSNRRPLTVVPRLLARLSVFLLLTACSLATPVLETFSATPSSLVQGEQTILDWTISATVDNASPTSTYRLVLLPENVDVTKFSSYLIAPEETTTYTLRLIHEGRISEAQTTVTVRPPNRAPSADALSVSTTKNEAVSFTLKGSDPDGDVVSFVVRDLPEHGTLGTLDKTTGQLSYRPDQDFSGEDSFTFSVKDDSKLSVEATVFVAVGVVPSDLKLRINSPDDGGTFTTSDNLVLSASAVDTEEGDLSDRVRWSSSLDGDLGTGKDLKVRLSRGVHTLSATVANAASKTLQADVSVTVAGAWTRQLGTAKIDVGYGVATDASGNVYVTGYTGGDLNGKNEGFDDYFLVKYDSSGGLKWQQQLGGQGLDIARSVATDPSGNVFVTGYKGQLDDSSVGGFDVFISKFDPAGRELWTKRAGTGGTDHAYGVATDSKGNAYITGLTDGDLAGAPRGKSDFYILKYAPDGDLVWSRQHGSADHDYARGITVDGSDNIYVAGYTEGDLEGASGGGSDLFIAKYDQGGERLWVTQVAASTSDVAYGVATDTSGNAYVAGYTEGGVSGNDLFLMKFGGEGSSLWTRLLGSAATDYARGIATDTSGNVYVTGYTEGSLDGYPSAGDFDVFLVKYSSNGLQQASWQLGTLGADYGYGVATDQEGNAFVTGSTQGGFDGNASSGGPDMFVIKYDVFGIKQ